MLGLVNLGFYLAIYDHDTLRQHLQAGEHLGNPIFYTALFLFAIIFFVFFWSRTGCTPGMQAWRLKILNEDKSTITPKQALIRIIITVPATGLFGIGFFWCYFNPQRKTLQDILSNSRIFYFPKHKTD